MTFSARRRLILLLREFVSNSVLYFSLGFTFCFISVTGTFVEVFKALDKSAFSVCVLPDLDKGGSHEQR
jgi:hypothetical protein